MASSFILFPKKPTLEAYKYIFSTALFIRAFGVTFLITITGTALSVLVTSMLAYGLKKPNLHGYKFFHDLSSDYDVLLRRTDPHLL